MLAKNFFILSTYIRTIFYYKGYTIELFITYYSAMPWIYVVSEIVYHVLSI